MLKWPACKLKQLLCSYMRWTDSTFHMADVLVLHFAVLFNQADNW